MSLNYISNNIKALSITNAALMLLDPSLELVVVQNVSLIFAIISFYAQQQHIVFYMNTFDICSTSTFVILVSKMIVLLLSGIVWMTKYLFYFFFSLYNNIHHPSKLVVGADFYCFKDKIEPKWEDPVCANGGKWTINCARGKSDTLWLYTVCSLTLKLNHLAVNT